MKTQNVEQIAVTVTDHRNMVDEAMVAAFCASSTIDCVQRMFGAVTSMGPVLVDEIYPIAEAMIGTAWFYEAEQVLVVAAESDEVPADVLAAAARGGVKVVREKVKLAVVDTNGMTMDGAWWHIHAHGCQDVQREVRQFRTQVDNIVTEDAKAWAEAERKVLNDDRRGECEGEAFGPEAFRIMPCVKGC